MIPAPGTMLHRARRAARRLWWRARAPSDRRRARVDLARALQMVEAYPLLSPAERAPHALPAPLIVSLTSWPPRFATLHLTLRSLLDQSIRPDRLILWIAHQDMAQLPPAVRRLTADGLEIRACDDLKSYKKLIPCLKAHPEAYIVTADDDVHYPSDWLAALVGAVDPAAQEVACLRAHLARFDRYGRALPYLDWSFETRRTYASGPRTALFPTGVGGILYPPGSLPRATLDESAFMRICPHADDIWFFWMARRNGYTHRRAPDHLRLVCWPDSQAEALFILNRSGHGNDIQIRAVEAEFGPIG